MPGTRADLSAARSLNLIQPQSTSDVILLVIGGLALFLLGMKTLSEGLKHAAGERLRHVLRIMTHNVFVGVLAGAVVTSIIQSSSVTTVMVVGFVNAGLMTLKQAIGVIMGANIGTTMTAWIVSGAALLQIANYALPAIAVGLLMNTVCRRNARHWGSVVLGFGLLFFGLELMKDAFGPLKASPLIAQLAAQFAVHPLLGVLTGTVITMIVQSSSATIATAQMLALTGVLSFRQAIPLVFGDNIGTTITAQIASVGTNVNARRAARAHMLFNLFGVIIMMSLVGVDRYERFILWLVPGELDTSNVMVHIAATHTVFNVVNTILFLPLTGLLAAAATKLVPGKDVEVSVQPQYLEDRLLGTPTIALEQARREVVRMMELAAGAFSHASDAFFRSDPSPLRIVAQEEEAVDNLQDKITRYLVAVSQQPLGETESNELPVLMHSVNDIERIGDHAVNLAEAAEHRIETRLAFTPAAIEELAMMRNEVAAMFGTVTKALRESDHDAARAAVQSEERLNAMEKQFRESHLRRLANGDCNFASGLTFVDCVYNFEKIGDHLLNAAQAVLGDFQWGEKIRAHAARAGQAEEEQPQASQPLPGTAPDLDPSG